MRTLCKKALALCVVFALALTCFVGTLSVSAADPIATITVGDVAIDQGTTSVDVILNITAAEPGINEAIISVSSELGTIKTEPDLLSSTATDGGKAILDWDGIADSTGDYSKFFLSAQKAEDATELNGITAAEIKLTFTVAADKAIGEYLINIDTEGVKAADKTEAVITYDYANPGKVTVVAPHVHNVVWTSDKAGNHTSSCDAEGCKDFEAVTEPCADNDADNACDKCGYVLVTEPECEHVWEVTSAAPGTATNAPGYINLTCAECGEESNDNVVTYHGKFRCNSYSVELKSEIILGYENAQDRYSSVPDGADSGVEFGFMVFTDSTDAIVSVLDLVNDKKLSSSGKYAYELKVASTDMLDTYGSTFYAYCDGQWYSGKTATASIAGLVTSNFATFDDAKKTLFVDLLNYGAAVQTRFGIKTEALANSTLTAEQLAYGTSETVPPSEYTAPDVDNSKDVYTTSYGLESKSKLILRYKFNAKNFKNSRGYTDATNLKAVVTYDDAWGIEHSTEYSYDPTTTELHDVEPLFTLVAGKTNQYEMAYLDFTACDFRIPITISFYDHKGVQVDQAVTFSVENLIATAIGSASENEVALFNAILNYCDSARAVFVD